MVEYLVVKHFKIVRKNFIYTLRVIDVLNIYKFNFVKLKV